MEIRALIVRAFKLGVMVAALSITPTAASQTPSSPAGRGLGLSDKPITTLPSSAKRYAVVIGVDQYADTQITTLGGASNDAKLLASVLIQNAGFPSDQVTVLASDQPTERQPTRGNILRRLSNMAAVVPRDGLLLLSFAGHGIERGGQAFLLPSDAQVSDDVELLEQTAINVTQVRERIRKIGVTQVLLILDACRNDPAGRSDADNPLSAAYTRGFSFDLRNREVHAFATLYATEVGRRAYEYREKKQGYFTWLLAEALRGEAANEKGEVTLAGLVKYLQERVPKRVLQDLGPGKEQKPFAVIEGYRADELVLSVGDTKGVTQQSRADSSGAPPPINTATRDAGIEIKPKDSITGLQGSTWAGSSPTSGDYTIEFLPEGKVNYIINVLQNGVTSPRTIKGTWKQSGNYVQIVIGNAYSVLQATVDGELMKGDGTNQDGTSWKFVLFKKN